MDLSFLKGFSATKNEIVEPTPVNKPKVKSNPKIESAKNNDIMVRNKKVTRKSEIKFVLNEKFDVAVQIKDEIYEIHNYDEIINGCVLYATPYNGNNRSRVFNCTNDGLGKRIDLLKPYWSRYDFKYEPIVLGLDSVNKKVIIKTKYNAEQDKQTLIQTT